MGREKKKREKRKKKLVCVKISLFILDLIFSQFITGDSVITQNYGAKRVI